MPQSLEEYAADQPTSTKCWLCARPELRTEVVAGRNGGLAYSLIASWLKNEHGYPYKASAVAYCLRNHDLA